MSMNKQPKPQVKGKGLLLLLATCLVFALGVYFYLIGADRWLFEYINSSKTSTIQDFELDNSYKNKGLVQGIMIDDSSGEKKVVNKAPINSSGSVLAVQDEVTQNSLVFRLPVYFFDLIHAASGKFDELLEVGTDLSVGNNVTIDNDLSVAGDSTLDGTLIVLGNVTAPNVVYSVVGGDGINVTGTQDLTIANDDPGSAQQIIKNFGFDGDTISAGSNDDTLIFESSGGVSFSTSGNTVTVSSSLPDYTLSGWTDGGVSVYNSTLTDNVGIGTSTANYKLDVVGTSNITGATTLGSTLGVTGATTMSGGASISSGLNNNSGGITNAGAITGATGLTSSGTITFSNLSTGILHSNVNGVVSSSAVNLAGGANEITGTLPVNNGGTGLTSAITGEIVYASAANTFSTLGIGAEGEVLTVSGGIPAWGSSGAGSPCATCIVNNPGSTQTIIPGADTATGLVIKQAASGSVDIFRVESNDGSNVYFKIDSTGNVTLGSQTSSGIFTVSPTSTDPISISPVAQGAGQYTGTITSSDLTVDRTWTFPDASGEVCLANGNCSGTAAAVGGSGTLNYLSKWSSTYGLENSLLYDNGTNVGIGSTSPAAKLDVVGTLNVSALTTLADDLQVDKHATISGSLRVDQPVDFNDTLGVTGATTLGSTLDVTGLATFGGNIGIGSATPGYKLDVVGELNLTDAIRVAGDAGASGYLLTSSAGGANTWTNPSSITTAGLWTNTLNVFHPKNELASVVDLAIGGTSTASADIQLYSNGSAVFNEQGNDSDFRIEATGQANALFVQGSDGNIGIGSSSPTSVLDVAGGITLDDGSQSTPSLRFRTSSNTGFYENPLGGGFVVYASGNQDRYWFMSNSLQSSNSSSFYLQRAAGSSTDPVFAFYDDEDSGLGRAAANEISLITSGSEAIRIDSSGNVGIGTSSPSSPLDLITENNTGGLVANQYGIKLNSDVLSGSTTNDLKNIYSSVNFSGSLTSAYGYYANFVTGVSGSLTNAYGYYAAGDSFGGTLINSYAGLYLDTAAPLASNTSFLVIDSLGALPTGTYGIYNASAYDNYFSGNLGIGSVSPGAKLDVVGTARFSNTLTFNGVSASTDNTVLLLNSSNQVISDEIDSRVWGSTLVDGSGSSNYLSKWSDANTVTTSQIYDNGTNVGIGSATPGNILDLDTTSATSGLSFDNKDALTGWSGDNYLRLNQSQDFTSGVYTPGRISLSGGLNVGGISDPGSGNLSVANTATVGDLECTSCIDTGDLHTATSNTSGSLTTGSSVSIGTGQAYTFFPNIQRTGGSGVLYVLGRNASDDGSTNARFSLLSQISSSNYVVNFRYVTNSRDPELFGWYDPELEMFNTLTRSEFSSSLEYPVEPSQTEGLIPVQITITNEELLTMDIEELRSSYRLSRYELASSLSSSDELAQILADREACLLENPDHTSFCVQPITVNGVYYGKLEYSQETAATYQTIANQLNAASNVEGADVAELYKGDPSISPGEIVAVSRDGNVELEKATQDSREKIVGAVSTTPGFLLGEASQGNIALALSGRVPVSVSNQNGEIKSGDKITIGKYPGIGEKATTSGTVVGVALEDFNSQDAEACVQDSSIKCGQILVFINVAQYSPSIVINFNENPQIEEISLTNYTIKIANQVAQIKQVEAFNKLITGFIDAGLVKTQKLVVENVAFIKNLGVDTLSINGVSLSNYIASVVGLENQSSDINIATPSAQLSTQQQIDLLKGLIEEEVSTSEATVSGVAIEENISFTDRISTFLREVVFTAQAKFMASVNFVKQVVFEDEVKFNQDTVGRFVVPIGVKKIKVGFNEQFTQAPTVYLSAQNQVDGGYALESTNVDGFIVVFDEEQLTEVTFDWFAVLGSGSGNAAIEVLDGSISPDPAGEVAGSTTTDPQTTPTPTPLPTPTPSSTAAPSVIPEATSEATPATGSVSTN